MTPPRPIVIGLVGGVGAGKSTVARILSALGCAVSDSDRQARAALDREDVHQTLRAWWGAEVFTPEGGVDRSKVAARVFADAAQRARLESLIHPLIAQARARELEAARAAGVRAFVIDAPLLLEAGLDRECDAVLFIDTPRDLRLSRVRASRSWDEAELARRESAQFSLERKKSMSDYEICNTGDEAALRDAVAAVLDRIIQHRG